MKLTPYSLLSGLVAVEAAITAHTSFNSDPVLSHLCIAISVVLFMKIIAEQ